jgi:hypothetical protein
VALPDAGTERARLLIKASNNVFFAVSPGNFTITGSGGTLSVTPSAGLVASGNEGGPFVNPSVAYTLKNTGKGPVDWTASKGATWLTVSPPSGTLEAGGEASVTVTVDETAAAALKRDHYQDTVVFANTTNGAGTTSRPVLLAVGQTFKEGLTVLEADGFDAWGFVGGPFSPSAKTFTIRNEGASDASWTAAKTADWITLSSTGGTIAPGGSETVLATLAGSRKWRPAAVLALSPFIAPSRKVSNSWPRGRCVSPLHHWKMKEHWP